jgi:dihydroorotate dehydrogenase (fumarate)
MSNLSTRYLGLDLRSPVIVSSSGLTDSLDKLKAAEDNLAGAVVLKSLFEEQINHEAGRLQLSSDYPEASDYISAYTKAHSLDNYLKLIQEAKASLEIPVIPSINCISSDDWTDFARHIENAGADAIEINVFYLPTDTKVGSGEAEKLYFDLIERIKRTVTIPVAIKIGPRFSNLLYMADQFYNRGVEGIVMFNRFFEPDIDVNTINITPAAVFSTPDDKRHVLRWVAMVDAMVEKISIAASTGVHSGQDVAKYILAGADAVQVCSALYRHGIEYLTDINDSLNRWMEQKEFASVDSFKGKLNYKNINEPGRYERAQFMRYFSSYE